MKLNRMIFVILALILCFTVPSFGKINTAIEVKVENQLERDYEFNFLGLSDIKADLTSLVSTVGVVISIGDNLIITPRVGVNSSEIKVAEVITLENTTGLALGISGSWLLAEPIESLSIFLIGDYLYCYSTIDKIQVLSLTIDNPSRTDIYRNDFEGGVKLTYSDIPINGLISLGIIYSVSTIDINVTLGTTDLDLELEATNNFGLRPVIEFHPVEDLIIALEGKLIDQKAVGIKIGYKF